MNTKQETRANATTAVFGSEKMLTPAPTQNIPQHKTTPEIAYQMVKDETYPQTQPRLNLATFVTTYMDEYATRLMNEAINVNYIDETEYPRVAVMCGRCLNIVANLWNTPEKAEWKTGALGIGSSEACMLGGVAAWLRWRNRRKAAGKPFDKPNLVMSAGFQVVWEKFCQLWQIELRTVPLTLDHITLDPKQALEMCDENTICIVPIAGVTWTGLDDDIEGLDQTIEDAFDPADLVYDPTVMCAVRNAGKWRRETVYEKQMSAKSLYTTINFPILRYADVLLMYAEAINEYAGAPDDQAKDAIREIRKRAGVKTDESLLGDYRSFRDLVRNERGRELAFEGLRKWDLIRWGTFVEKMHNAGTNQPTENKYRNVSYTNYASANYANVTARHIYLPIPTKELAVNHALRQNPLW